MFDHRMRIFASRVSLVRSNVPQHTDGKPVIRVEAAFNQTHFYSRTRRNETSTDWCIDNRVKQQFKKKILRFSENPTKMTTEVIQLPHIEVFHRLLVLPVVESALSKSVATYSRVKDCHQLVHWTLTTAENSLSSVTKQAVPTVAPIVKKLENLVQFVDHTLCLGLDKIEEKVPLVKEKPEQILQDAYKLANNTVSSIAEVRNSIIRGARHIGNKSWDIANQILGTQYGCAAVNGLDITADAVDKLIDKYLAATEDEQIIVINTNDEDKLRHTLQVVNRLSNKAARRVYSNIMLHLSTINMKFCKCYIGSVVHILDFKTYLHTENNKTEDHTTANSKNASNAESKKVN